MTEKRDGGARLTQRQAELLPLLPPAPEPAPCDGLYLKGPRRRVADALVALGLARRVAAGLWVGAYYVRTDTGAALLAARERGQGGDT